MGVRLRVLGALVCISVAACGSGEAEAPQVPAASTAVVVFGAEAAGVHAGVTDLTDVEQAGMAAGGWALPGEGEARPDWIWSSAQESSLWIAGPREAGTATALELEVRSPAFIEEPFSIHVELNDVDLGSLPIQPDTESVSLELPPGFKVLPMNRLELAGSHWSSPLELGVGDDPRRLSFSFRSAHLGELGEELLVRRLKLLPGAVLEAAQDVQVIDLETLDPVVLSELGGDRRAIQTPAVGREVGLICPRSPAASAVRMTVPPGYLSVVLIVIDTLRADAINLVATPNIDRLKEGGVVFGNAFANAPMTLPSHAALLSGRLPSTAGVVNNGQDVPEELPLFSEQLGDQGFQTLAVVSIETLWPRVTGAGLDRGFQRYLRDHDLLPTGEETGKLLQAELEAGQLEEPFILLAHFSDPHDPYRAHRPVEPSLELVLDGEPFATIAASRAPEFQRSLRLGAGEHNLAWSAHGDLVAPLKLGIEADDKPLEPTFVLGGIRQFQEDTKVTFSLEESSVVELDLWISDYPTGMERILRYGGEVQAADRAVGKLLDELERAGVLDESLVIFTADHGEAFGEHGYFGHAENLFDELLRVPLIIRPPVGQDWDPVRGQLRNAAREVVSLADLSPTVMALLGREPLPGTEGRSLLSPASEPPLIRAETHAPEASRDTYCIRNADWKLIYTPDTSECELYDLRSDPHERVNVFAAHGQEFDSWRQELVQRAESWSVGSQPPSIESTDAKLRALGY